MNITRPVQRWPWLNHPHGKCNEDQTPFYAQIQHMYANCETVLNKNTLFKQIEIIASGILCVPKLEATSQMEFIDHRISIAHNQSDHITTSWRHPRHLQLQCANPYPTIFYGHEYECASEDQSLFRASAQSDSKNEKTAPERKRDVRHSQQINYQYNTHCYTAAHAVMTPTP